MKLKRIWGIPIRRVFSDDEFVERLRKFLKHSKKLLLLYIPLLILLCYCLPDLYRMFMDMIDEMTEGEQFAVLLGMMLGTIIGMTFAQCIISMGQSILMAFDLFDYNRANKLLIKYHDMLKENGLLEEEQGQNG
jgi:hypothetical protein